MAEDPIYIEIPNEPVTVNMDDGATIVIELLGGTSTAARWGWISGNIEDQTDLMELLATPIDEKTAGETIHGSRAIRIGSDGKAYHPSSANTSHAEGIVGLSKDAASSGDIVEIVEEGVLTEPSWAWNPGSLIYLNGTGGQLSETPPTSGFCRSIAVALTATSVRMQLGDTTVLA